MWLCITFKNNQNIYPTLLIVYLFFVYIKNITRISKKKKKTFCRVNVTVTSFHPQTVCSKTSTFQLF